MLTLDGWLILKLWFFIHTPGNLVKYSVKVAWHKNVIKNHHHSLIHTTQLLCSLPIFQALFVRCSRFGWVDFYIHRVEYFFYFVCFIVGGILLAAMRNKHVPLPHVNQIIIANSQKWHYPNFSARCPPQTKMLFSYRTIHILRSIEKLNTKTTTTPSNTHTQQKMTGNFYSHSLLFHLSSSHWPLFAVWR